MCYISGHNHLAYSNIRLPDCINTVEGLIQTAHDLGLKGIAITDHETVSGHVQAIKVTRELKEKGKIAQDFKLILGNELYLVDSLEDVRDNYKSGVTKFPHFLIMAKDRIGHEQMRYMSSMAWDNSFYTGTMLRVPTVKKLVEEVVGANKGHLIATSACLGSELSQCVLNDNDEGSKQFLEWCIHVFGQENFFLELQPALSQEQIKVNHALLQYAEMYNLRHIISTDTHYLRPEDRVIHKAFLNSKDGDREVDDFYEATYLHTEQEVYDRMEYLDKTIIQQGFDNSLLIGEMVEDYTIENPTDIPKIQLPDFEVAHIFAPAYEQYDYIKKMAYADDEQDRYILKLIEDGFQKHIPKHTLTKEKFHEILARIDVELGELWEISQVLNQTMSSYYITTAKIVDLIWQDDECGGNSLVGSGRGSSSGFLICFLLGITQINPLEYGVEMPHWRHLHRSRADVSALDIDIDVEPTKKNRILQALKKHFGDDRVLPVCTFGTEGSKSAIQTACRGLGYDSDIGLHISSLIPFERGQNWSIKDCLHGNEDKERKAVTEFINEIEKHPNLKETALKIEGLINKRSIHAGGVLIYNDPYYKTSAMMKAPNGTPTTQFNLDDSQSLGGIKYDILIIEALAKIRATLDLLIESDEIKNQENLRVTFEKYLHPNAIEKENQEYYKLMGDGVVPDLFQFSTEIGLQTAIKAKPTNLIEMSSANSLMRLQSNEGEQPIDTFVRFKSNIQLWYDELKSYNLTEPEIKVMEKYLLPLNGVADSQECVMLMSMDKQISGFSVKESSTLRKTIAKRKQKDLDEAYALFFKKGKELGTSDNLLSYVWDVQIKRLLSYAFSVLHSISYSVIALQELTLYHNYNSLYWASACLTSNSASDDESSEESKNSSTNYGKVASAIGKMKQFNVEVSLPDINKARFSFKPNIEDDCIVYGLKGLVGINDDIVHEVINNRPYTSFTDFYDRLYTNGSLQTKHMVQLIKAGCFDSLGDRMDTMKQFISFIYPKKEKITMQNFATLINYNLIPDEYDLQKRLYNFKKYVAKLTHSTEGKDKRYLLDDKSQSFFEKHFTNACVIDTIDEYSLISDKLLDKEYKKLIEPIKEWMQSEATLQLVNETLFQEEWDKQASGTISRWEMDSLSFYYHEHELANVNMDKYQLSNFFTLPEDPVVTSQYKQKGITRYKYQLTSICGTVLDKDKNKHTVTLLTPDGVVTVKYYDGAFAHYNKQESQTVDGKKEVLEKSWFSRGNLLVVYGYRRGNQFKPQKYNDSYVTSTTMLIKSIKDNGDIVVQSKRISV